MKKLVSLFLWTCAATVIAQACILTLSLIRGNLNKDTMVTVIAMLNGIDIQGKRLATAYVSAQQTPVPTFEDIAAERAKLSLEFDSRERFLERQKQALDSMLVELRDKESRFEARRVEFFNELLEMRKVAEGKGVIEEQRQFEMLAPDLAKSILLRILKEDGGARNVVTIIKGMTDEKRKKIAAEFTKEEEAQLLEILVELRKGDPEASLIRDAQNGQKSGAP